MQPIPACTWAAEVAQSLHACLVRGHPPAFTVARERSEALIQSAQTLADWAHALRESVDLGGTSHVKTRTELEFNLHKLAWAADTDDAGDATHAVLEGVRSVRVFEGQPIPEITALVEGSRTWPEATRNAAAYELVHVSSAFKETSCRILAKALDVAQEQVEVATARPAPRFNGWRVLALFGWLLVATTFIRFPVKVSRAQAWANSQYSCLANLKMLYGAKATWQIEKRKADTDVPSWADIVGQGAYIRDKPVCPKGGQYSLHMLSLPPSCSIHGKLH